MAIQVERYRFTAADYHRLAEAGILGEDDRVELIAGEIVEMSPVGGRHVEAVSRFTRLLSRQVGDGMLVNVQSPIRLTNDGEPEPDLAVVRDRAYGGELPTAADVLLVIEVADTSLRRDRDIKLPRYAEAGIPEVWIADLRRRQLLVYRNPQGARYAEALVLGLSDEVSPLSFPDVTIRVADVFV